MNRPRSSLSAAPSTREVLIAIALLAIGLHMILRFRVGPSRTAFGLPARAIPLLVALACGAPLVDDLAIRLFRREFSSDLLAGISIVTSLILGEYLAGTPVVLMLSGGQALEAFAVRRASFALEALARRMLSDDEPTTRAGPRSGKSRETAPRPCPVPAGRQPRRNPGIQDRG